MDLVREYRGVLIAVAALLVALMASVVQVPETQQAVVVRFGEPIKKINSFDQTKDFGQTGAGLVLRIPFADRLVRIDKRLMTVDMEPQQILS
ncbi:MAG: protease modulator HflC, partial [Alphaproteobacteria bacterium]|nr:protease modulator HflC [Alphaproteobacteria bacterium]